MLGFIDTRGVTSKIIAVVASLSVLASASVAVASNDFNLSDLFRLTEQPGPTLPDVRSPETAGPTVRRHRRGSPRWAGRKPLRITLRRSRRADRRGRWATPAWRVPATRRAARKTVRGPRIVTALPTPREVLFQPPPQRPAIVSLYEDRTLRRGDAVMMRDGIRLFLGDEASLHRTGDFVKLSFVTSLDWQLRKTLDDLDRHPPDRWAS